MKRSSRKRYGSVIACLLLLFALASCDSAPKAVKDPAAATDKGFAYITKDNKVTVDGFPLLDADTKSFKVLDEHAGYAKDAKKVYFQYSALDGADPASFVVLANARLHKPGKDSQDYYYGKVWAHGNWRGYAKDKKAVYKNNQMLTGANPKTFAILHAGLGYAKDDKNVYFEGSILEGADAATFTIVGAALDVPDTRGYSRSGSNRYTGYAKDKNSVYYNGKAMQDTSPENFVMLGKEGIFYANNDTVFYDGQQVYRADRKNFTIISGAFARDGKYLYFGNNNFDQDTKQAVTVTVVDQPPFAQRNRHNNGKLYYTKTPTGVFTNGYRHRDINPESFTLLPEPVGYFKDDKNVYSYYSGPIRDIDVASAQALADSKVYLRDATSVYYESSKLRDVDPNTAKVYGKIGRYLRSGDVIYFGNSKINSTNPESFRVLESSLEEYAVDDKQVYYQGRRLYKADPATFAIIDELTGYSKDANNVFRHNSMLREADPATFTMLGNTGEYAKDAASLYSKNYRLDNADPDTFTIVDSSIGLARDKNQIFYQGRPLTGSHAPTFTVMARIKNTRYDRGETVYAKDRRWVYCNYRVLQGSDPATFTLLGDSGYAKDANNVYSQCNVLRDADAATFVPDPKLSKLLERPAAQDKNGLWFHSWRSDSIKGPVSIIGESRWLRGNGTIAYSYPGGGMRSIQADTSTFAVADIPDYAYDATQSYYQGQAIEGLDAKSLQKLPIEMPQQEKKSRYIPPIPAWDGKAIYMGNRLVHSFTGKAALLPTKDGKPVPYLFFKDDKGINLFTPNENYRREGYVTLLQDADPASFKELCTWPMSIISQDATSIFFDTYPIKGIKAAGAECFHAGSDGYGIKAADGIVLFNGGRLFAHNPATGELVPIGQNGFKTWKTETKNGMAIITAFDGRFHLRIDDTLVLRANDEGPGISQWSIMDGATAAFFQAAPAATQEGK